GDGPMLADDAREIATELQERLAASSCQGAKAAVKVEELKPKSVPAGAGRPTFINYYIQVDDGTRMATLTLGQAAGLLDEIQPEWDADRLFDAIRALDVPVEDPE
ncbi:MAG TPA: hypothetical protein VFO16_08370, partial [Pseudonocardiaceae bacterium]|nr:hypothetical protein [Pseudonocardiaceae bacterium]